MSGSQVVIQIIEGMKKVGGGADIDSGTVFKACTDVLCFPVRVTCSLILSLASFSCVHIEVRPINACPCTHADIRFAIV